MTKKSIKNTISLLLITVIAGLLLGVVYEITKAPIAAGQQKAKEEACKIVFASAASFEQVEIDEAQVEEMVELYYNSNQFRHTLSFLEQAFPL